MSTITCYGYGGGAFTGNFQCPGSDACCGDISYCTDTRLCLKSDGELVRAPCMNNPYTVDTCAQVCLYNETTGVLPRLTICEDGSYCCNNDPECCVNKTGVFLNSSGISTGVDSPSATTSSSSTSSTSSPTTTTTTSSTSKTTTSASGSTSSSTTGSTTSATTGTTTSATGTSTGTSASTTASSDASSNASSTTSAAAATSSSSSSGLSAGAAAGIGVGAAIAVILIALAAFLFYRKRKNSRQATLNNGMIDQQSQYGGGMAGRDPSSYGDKAGTMYGAPSDAGYSPTETGNSPNTTYQQMHHQGAYSTGHGNHSLGVPTGGAAYHNIPSAPQEMEAGHGPRYEMDGGGR